MTGGTSWSAGADNSDSDAYVVSNSTALGTNNYLTITTSGIVALPGAGFTTAGVLYNTTGGVLASTAAGTSGQVLTSNGAGVAPTYQTPLLLNTGNIAVTNAQLKGMSVTPVQMIAAPAAGFVIIIVSWTLKLVYGGTSAFTGGGTIQLVNTGLESIANTIAATTLNQAASGYAIRPGNSGGIVTEANYQASAVSLNNITAAFAGNAENNNTALVNITYQVVSM